MGDFFHALFSEEGLRTLITTGGMPILFGIIFAETGLFIGFFLPGDTLLISAGLLSATDVITVSFIGMNAVLMAAAILGNTVGYYIGRAAGKKLFERPSSRFFRREHLVRTHEFYEKHGFIAMVLARFIPIVRTFAPVVAGAVGMGFRRFTLYNFVGAVLWIGAMTSVGYFLAHAFPELGRYLHLAILGVIGVSFLLPLVQWFRTRKRSSAKS
jgi:membrane-associated protein